MNTVALFNHCYIVITEVPYERTWSHDQRSKTRLGPLVFKQWNCIMHIISRIPISINWVTIFTYVKRLLYNIMLRVCHTSPGEWASRWMNEFQQANYDFCQASRIHYSYYNKITLWASNIFIFTTAVREIKKIWAPQRSPRLHLETVSLDLRHWMHLRCSRWKYAACGHWS